ncbi:hypothetical protein LCGC14_2352110 [marine sediment metagenome]|uniref:Uncharacterized protein n=1 Tax=marine sediment metagenome TaxID=412755 RepID=A0A0F9CWJ0_9ZZZZ
MSGARTYSEIVAELERLAVELRQLRGGAPRVTCGHCHGRGGIVGHDGKWKQCDACSGYRRT